MIRNENMMKKTILTKYCNLEEPNVSNDNNFEERFEQYIENKVKKVVNNPQKYPFITIMNKGGSL